MPLHYNRALNLTESELRSAMQYNHSVSAIARYLGCNFVTVKKYAKLYVNENGVSLYSEMKNMAGKGLAKEGAGPFKKTNIFDVLDGKATLKDNKKFLNRLLEECVFPEACCQCGYNERRLSDYKVPLVLNFIDGDKQNKVRENIELLCYNCYFQSVGDVFTNDARTKSKMTLVVN